MMREIECMYEVPLFLPADLQQQHHQFSITNNNNNNNNNDDDELAPMNNRFEVYAL